MARSPNTLAAFTGWWDAETEELKGTLAEAVDLYCKDAEGKQAAIARHGPIEAWDTSQVTSMRRLFACKTRFNEEIGPWSMASVTSMREMFCGATAFNQPLPFKDMANVTDMR